MAWIPRIAIKKCTLVCVELFLSFEEWIKHKSAQKKTSVSKVIWLIGSMYQYIMNTLVYLSFLDTFDLAAR